MRDVDDARPAARSSATRAKRRSASVSASEAVGSSMIRTRACAPTARAISTSCCSGMRSEPASASGSTVAPDSRQERGRALAPLPPIDAPPGASRLQAEGDVLGDRQVGEQGGLLVDRGDAQRRASSGSARSRGRPAMVDGARVRRVGAGDDLDQRGLARAVFADQRVHLARAQVEGHAAQRTDGAERLGDAAELEERVHRRGSCHRRGASSRVSSRRCGRPRAGRTRPGCRRGSTA